MTKIVFNNNEEVFMKGYLRDYNGNTKDVTFEKR